MEWPNLEDIKNIFNTLFFITTGTVAILTYRQARKTVLQPLRTEVFKEQIKIMGEILELFNGKNQNDLKEDLDFRRIFDGNCQRMFDTFARYFFNVNVNKEKRLYSDFRDAIVSVDFLNRNFTLADNDVKEVAASKEQVIYKNEEALEIWSRYQLGMVSVSNKFSEYEKNILKLASSPMIPTELSDLLNEYLNEMQKCIVKIDEVITRCAQEMSDRYKNIDSLRKSSNNWIYTVYPKDDGLEECARNIIVYIRNYFDTDNLIKK